MSRRLTELPVCRLDVLFTGSPANTQLCVEVNGTCSSHCEVLRQECHTSCMSHVQSN